MDSRLHDACVDKDLNQLKQLFEEGVDTTLRDNDGNTVYHLLCAPRARFISLLDYSRYYSRLEVLQYVTDVVYGSIVVSRVIGLRNSHGQTALQLACQTGCKESVKFLIQCSDFKSVIEGHGPSLLRVASDADQYSVIEVLLEEGWLNFFPIEDIFRCINNLEIEELYSLSIRILSSLSLEEVREYFAIEGVGSIGPDRMYWYVVETYKLKYMVLVESALAAFSFEQFFSRAVNNGDVELARFVAEEKAELLHCTHSSSALHEASGCGFIKIVHFLVDELNIGINIRDADGSTPLHEASFGGCLEVVQYLTSHKDCEVDARDPAQRTPLLMASQGSLNSHLDVVQHLVKRGCNVNAHDKFGNTTIHYAGQSGHFHLVKFLAEQCQQDIVNNRRETALHIAVRSGHAIVVQHLVSQGYSTNAENEDGCTPFCLCFHGNNYEFLAPHTEHALRNTQDKDYKVMLKAKSAQVTLMDSRLHNALLVNDFKKVKQLIETGIDPTLRSFDGNSVLHLVCASSTSILVALQYLTNVMYGSIGNSRINTLRNCHKSTPLHLTCYAGRVEFVQYLSRCPYFYEAVGSHDVQGNTPLYYAISGGHQNVVQLFLAHEKRCWLKLMDVIDLCSCVALAVDKQQTNIIQLMWTSGNLKVLQHLVRLIGHTLNDQDKNGRTVLHLACRKGQIQVVKYLTSLGQVDCEAKCFKNCTPLHEASRYGHKEIVQHLVGVAGCNVNAKDINGISVFHYACTEGCTDVVKYFTSLGLVDCEEKGFKNRTPLHEASLNGQVQVVQHLVSVVGCNVNAQADNGITALHCACMKGHIEVVKYLTLLAQFECEPKSFKNGAHANGEFLENRLESLQHHVNVPSCNVNAQDEDGNTALHYGCIVGQVEVVKYLTTLGLCDIESKNLENQTPLHVASLNGHFEVVKHLVSIVNCDLNAKDNDGVTALHCASFEGHVKIVKYLTSTIDRDRDPKNSKDCLPANDASQIGHLENIHHFDKVAGCNVNAQDKYGDTPLHYACTEGHIEIVKHLTSLIQCDCEAKGFKFRTPLHEASLNGHFKIVQHLVSVVRCNVNAQNENGITALHFACNENHMEIVKYLTSKAQCSCEVNINIKDKNGNTALHFACEVGHVEIVKYLTTIVQCDSESKGFKNRTPLHVASLNSHLKIVQHLVSAANCNVSAQDKNGDTAVNLASKGGDLNVVKYLVNVGCATKIPNKQGKTALHVANYYNHKNIVEYLRMFDSLRHYKMAAQATKLVKVKPVKCIMSGPPGAGKTTTKRRLLDEPLPELSTSTGVVDAPLLVAIINNDPQPVAVHSVSQQSAVVPILKNQTVCWKKQDLHEELLSLPLQFSNTQDVEQQVLQDSEVSVISNQSPYDSPRSTNMSDKNSCVADTIKTKHSTSTLVDSASQFTNVAQPISNLPLTRIANTDSETSLDESVASKEVIRMIDKIPEAKKSEYFHTHDDNVHDASPYIIDTGGQPEFYEILPALITGPAINLLTFKLTEDLHTRYEIQYRLAKESSKPYKTSLTHEEMMFRSLASIACLQHTIIGWQFDEAPMEDKSEPAAFLIGTHRDQVNKENLSSINEQLKMKVECSPDLFENLVQYSSEEQVVFALDNLHDIEEINNLRGALNRTISERFKAVEVPLSWQLFSLKLRESKQTIHTMASCEKLASESGISVEDGELKAALWFLHNRVGVLMYYPDIEGLDGIVIVQLQVLFDRITDLITSCFTFTEMANASTAKKFREFGTFTDEDMKKLPQTGPGSLTHEQVISLLKHMHILAVEIIEKGRKRYFMPCALKPANIEEEEENEEEDECSPLLVWFKCGYVPVGVFCCLVVYLLDNSQSTACELKWALGNPPHYRNKIKFFVGHCYDTITLICRATYLEVKLAKRLESMSASCPLFNLSNGIRSVLHEGLETVIQSLHYTNKSQHQFGFHCSCQSPRHPAVCSGDSPVVKKCVTGGSVTSLEDRQLVWFTKKVNTWSNVAHTDSQYPFYYDQEALHHSLDSLHLSEDNVMHHTKFRHHSRLRKSTFLTQAYSKQQHQSTMATGEYRSSHRYQLKGALSKHHPISSTPTHFSQITLTENSKYPSLPQFTGQDINLSTQSTKSQDSPEELQSPVPHLPLHIGIDSLDLVLEELKTVVHWERIGVYLGLLYSSIQKIKKDYGMVDDCKMGMLAAWLNGEDNVKKKGGPTWQQLVEALKKCGERHLGYDIEQKYLSKRSWDEDERPSKRSDLQ